MAEDQLKKRIFAMSAQLISQTRLPEARGLLITLLAYHPNDQAIRLQLAHICREMGEYRDAEKLLNIILAQNPQDVPAKAQLSLTYFYQEDWKKAWAAFDVRFKLMDKPPLVTKTTQGKKTEIPMWDGHSKPKSLLVLNEQGLGDSIQFARFLPELTKRGIKTTFVAPKRLHSLFAKLCQDIALQSQEEARPVEAECWLPLMELPPILNIPPSNYARGAYLSQNKEKYAAWRDIIGQKGYKIGLVWQGNPLHSADSARSLPLEAYASLATLPGVRLFSLQHGQGSEQIQTCSFKERLTCFHNLDQNNAFEDTAAIIANLDLVVTIDSSISHLAGALGVNCALLLMRIGADWRWLAREKTSIWYEHHTLYRQSKMGEWGEPIARLRTDILARLVPNVMSPPLVPDLLVGEGLEKTLRLALQAQKSEDAGEIKTLIRHRLALTEWLETQNMPLAKKEALLHSYQEVQNLQQELRRQIPLQTPLAQRYFTALEAYELLKL